MAGDTLLKNRYRLEAQQGSGGMSVIYRAVDQQLGRRVAVKILRPSLTSDASFLEKFRNEARSVANLSHPNLVTVHDFDNDGPTYFIVMELIEGTDLKKMIRDLGALNIDRAVNLAIQICAGIGFAHRSGLVHADVKPQNILVTREDVVKVTDFGIAQALSDTQPQQREELVWGSPHYFAPEQARGERPSPASDVYAIGIVMFEMLTGRLPYIGTSQRDLALAHIQQPIPKVSEANPAVPESLVQIVYKVMSKEPLGRYRSADQLGHVLTAYRDRARGLTADSPPVPPEVRPSAPTVPRQAPVSPPSGHPPSPPLSPPSEPTQRYGAAPVAPQYEIPRPASIPSPVANQGARPPQPAYAPQPLRGDSAPYVPPQYQSLEPEESHGLDLVTIALAILAFLAVACLIPLYVVVWQVLSQ